MLLEVLCVVLVILVSHVIFKKIFGDSDKIVDDSYSNGTASNKSGAGSDSDSGSDSESSGSESDESDKEKPRMTILFGSQSGTAEGFAGEIEEEASSKGFRAKVYDLEDYDRSRFKKEKFVVFMQATYGEGDPTDNAVDFFEWLKNDENHPAEKGYKNLVYAVFALGNRQYEHFANAGKTLDARLEELHAKRLLEVGVGDDDGSLQDDFEEWKSKFWSAAKEVFVKGTGIESLQRQDSGSADAESADTTHFEPKFSVEIKHDDPSYKHGDERNFKPHDAKHHSVLVPVVENRELREGNKTDPDSSTRHVEFSILNTNIHYETADNLYLWPKNSPTLVKKALKPFNLQEKDVLYIKPKTKNAKLEKLGIPEKIGADDLFSWYLDINSIVSHRQLKFFLKYTDNEKTKELIHGWLHDEHKKKEFQELQISVMEMLETHKDIKIPINEFIEWGPKMKPRPYTISSSNKVQPDRIAITLSLHVKPLPNNRRHEGTATHYLRGLQPGKDKAWIYITPSTFRLPKAQPGELKHKSVPVVMIGPGTGLAPFRGFCHEIAHLRNKENLHVGPAVLFYGCRNQKIDYIYEDELTEHVTSQLLHKLFLAFSRDQKATGDGKQPSKRYVQHLLYENGELIWDLIYRRHGVVYVCGGTAMGAAIRDTIVRIAEEIGNMSHERAKEFLAEMQAKHRYIAELWS